MLSIILFFLVGFDSNLVPPLTHNNGDNNTSLMWQTCFDSPRSHQSRSIVVNTNEARKSFKRSIFFFPACVIFYFFLKNMVNSFFTLFNLSILKRATNKDKYTSQMFVCGKLILIPRKHSFFFRRRRRCLFVLFEMKNWHLSIFKYFNTLCMGKWNQAI